MPGNEPEEPDRGTIIERVSGGQATEMTFDHNEIGIPRVRTRGLDVPLSGGPATILSGPRPSTVPTPLQGAKAAAEKRARENPPRAEPVKVYTVVGACGLFYHPDSNAAGSPCLCLRGNCPAWREGGVVGTCLNGSLLPLQSKTIVTDIQEEA
jgi:hypothetical protein